MSALTYKRPRLGWDEERNDVVAGMSNSLGRTINCNKTVDLRGRTFTYRPPYQTLWSLKKAVFGCTDPLFGQPKVLQYFGRLEAQAGAKDAGFNNVRAYNLEYVEGATVNGVAGCNLPMHLIDLTQRLSTTGGLVTRPVMHRFDIQNSSPDMIVLTPLNGLGNDGSTNVTAMQRYSSTLYTDFDKLCDPNLTGSLLEEINLDMYFVGPNFDAEVRVDIVQFDEEETEPFVASSAYKTAFWWNLVHKYISNPINRLPTRSINQGNVRKMRVLHTENVFLTGNPDGSRSRAICKLRLKTDHLCAWKAYPTIAPNPGINKFDDPNVVEPVTADVPLSGSNATYLPDFRHRIYAIIRGLAVSVPTDGTSNSTASRIGYDLRLITRHQISPNGAE